ncbi:hypothetical protein VM1G_07668 [Cytospora mali]|uniref:Uncharacterized protein n=1 Tax=Cytospora mali TaxID=578113 RepID=A0A194W8M5_CYTMA|nr:hypothetical protein VM1G_07668 [Valsa mali]
MAIREILDSKFAPNRTGLRTWRELRFIGKPLWSDKEEAALIRDCQAIADEGPSLITPLSSNSILWAACFERYGVPLTDLFTYGLKPHPKSKRGLGATYLTPLCCQSLTEILIHPIFQAEIDLVRYVLQYVICLRMGVHVPPLGPVPDMDDATCNTLPITANIIYEADEKKDKVEANHDAIWLYMQESGLQTHPDIVNLERDLREAFELGEVPKNKPGDSTPHCRRLFYLQLWDLQFLVQILNDTASPQGYMPTAQYHKQWLRATGKIRPFMMTKVEGLAEAWFLHDERSHRVREKVNKCPGRALFDIPEEGFRPLYAKSDFITVSMRSVLCGDFLVPASPLRQKDKKVNKVQEVADEVNMQDTGDSFGIQSNHDDANIRSTDDRIQNTEDGVDVQSFNNNFRMQSIEEDTDVQSTEDDDATIIVASGVNDAGDSDEYNPFNGDAEPEDDTEMDLDDQDHQDHQRRSDSIMSIFSISSSTAEEWEYNEGAFPASTNEHISQRGLLVHNRYQPAFRRRE